MSPTQSRDVLGICRLQEFAEGDIVCTRNSPSEEMFILVSGELAVLSEDGVVLADLHPVTTVGEMGLITRQDRSELADRLREERPELPVVALSGVVSRQDTEGHSFVDFIDKPMRLDDFRRAIELVLGHQEEDPSE